MRELMIFKGDFQLADEKKSPILYSSEKRELIKCSIKADLCCAILSLCWTNG
jgi:hypothetical protein